MHKRVQEIKCSSVFLTHESAYRSLCLQSPFDPNDNFSPKIVKVQHREQPVSVQREIVWVLK